MADPKEAPKKEAPKSVSNSDATEQLIFLLVGLIVLGAIVTALLSYIKNFNLANPNTIFGKITNYFFARIWPIWKIVAGIVSVSALAGVIYNTWKLRLINVEEQKIYGAPPLSTPGPKEIAEKTNKKWELILKHLNSSNVSDWRLAILEADVILEELLRTLGYVGESVGEMLKSADRNEFSSLDDAWEAHKIRNAIAHSGTNFDLNEREAKRVISLFEKVFKEFGII